MTAAKVSSQSGYATSRVSTDRARNLRQGWGPSSFQTADRVSGEATAH